MATLKDFLEDRLINGMIKSVAVPPCPGVVLVLDPVTSKVLSSCCRMYDVMEAGVLVVENLQVNRERMPDLPAIYFVEPTNKNILRILDDFGKNTNQPQYACAHLYFTARIRAEEMELISGSKIVRRIKSLVELNVDFVANEGRVFSFNIPGSIQNLFWPASQTILSKELDTMSRKLVSLMLTMEELPNIRYWAASPNGIAQSLATFVNKDLKKTVGKLQDWKPNEKRERGTLLILDRTIDVVSPLMHEFTYQAMIQDILRTEGELCFVPYSDEDKKAFRDKYPASSTRSAEDKAKLAADLEELKLKITHVLSEDDQLWQELRHEHIAEVMKSVNKKFEDFKKGNNMAALQKTDKKGASNTTVKDMLKAMKDMPKYRELIKKYAKHMALAEACMKQVDQRNLLDIGVFEQDVATGMDQEGATVKNLKTPLAELCVKSSVGAIEKLRLVMLFLSTQGTKTIQADTRADLLKGVDDKLQVAISHLTQMGIGKDKPSLAKTHVEDLKKRYNEFEAKGLTHMRWIPAIRLTLSNLVTDKLSQDSFPYLEPPPQSDRKEKKGRTGGAGRNWRRGQDNKADKGEDDTRPQFIVFVLGGITYSEIRTMYEIAAASKVNLFIGSSSLLSPNDYIRDMADMDKDKFKAALAKSQVKDADEELEQIGAAVNVDDVVLDVRDSKQRSKPSATAAAPAKKKAADKPAPSRKPVVDDDFFD